MKEFFQGIQVNKEALSLIKQERSLLVWFLIPFLLQIMLFFLGIHLATSWVAEVVTWVFAWLSVPEAFDWGSGFLWSSLEFFANGFLKIAHGLMWITTTLVLFLVLFLIGLIIAAPIYDVISETTEFAITGQTPPTFSLKALLRSIKTTLIVDSKKFILLTPIPIILLVLGFLPAVGPFFSLFAIQVYSSLAFAFAFIDFPMSRWEIPFGQRVAFVKRNWLACFGFGLWVYVPIVNFILAPFFAVGATVLYVKLRESKSSQPTV